MRKFLTLIVLIGISCKPNAQIYNPIEKLVDSFHVYYLATEKEASKSFMEGTLQATVPLLQRNNINTFKEAKKALHEKFPDLKSYFLAVKLIDAIYKEYEKKYLWVNDSSIIKQFDGYFVKYNTEVCPCLTTRIKKTDGLQQVLAAQRNCIASADIQQWIKNNKPDATLEELSIASRKAASYILTACDAIKSKVLEAIVYRALNEYETFSTDIKTLDLAIVNLYKKNSVDKLEYHFTNFRKFESEIKTSTPFISQNGIVRISDVSTGAAEHITVTNTYGIEESKKMILKGQVVYTLLSSEADNTIIEWKFIPAEKIANPTALIKKLEKQASDIANNPPPLIVNTLENKN